MNKELLLRDTLLFITILLVSFGAVELETNFTQAMIALGVGAIAAVLRIVLKDVQRTT